MTPDEVKRLLWQASWGTNDRAPVESEYNYWIEKEPELTARGIELRMPDYMLKKMQGWQAGINDRPKFGTWGTVSNEFHPVPPYPSDVIPSAENTTENTAENTDDEVVKGMIQGIKEAKENSIQALIELKQLSVKIDNVAKRIEEIRTEITNAAKSPTTTNSILNRIFGRR